MSIEAIETNYRGYRFRSRLEARWAVFFDSIDVEWNYELEGYKLPSGEMYLPDFQLPDVGLRSTEEGPLWIEVKGRIDGNLMSNNPVDTLTEFAEAKGEPAALLVGDIPSSRELGRSTTKGLVQVDSNGWIDYPMAFMKCEECGEVKLEFMEGHYMQCESCGATCTYRHQLVKDAVRAARAARFEHGEQPV